MGFEEKYATEVDCSTTPMADEEYTKLMQTLNLRQSEICAHVMQWIQTKTDPMYIFIEGGAGVGKTKAAKAIYESMNRFYRAQPGTNPDQVHCIVLAPTGMAAYHVKGNTIHSGLHIDINKDKLTPLTSSELNTLRSKYLQSKALFYDEISMVGRRLWNKGDQRLKEIFGTKKDFGGLHVIAVGDFYQMAPVRDCYVFKDDDRGYGPLATNLWTNHMQVYTLTDIMWQRDEKKFCEILNRLRTGDSIQEDHEIFESHTVSRTDDHYLSQTHHFFPLKITTRNHNEFIYVNTDSEKMAIHAYDFVTGNPSEKVKQKCKLHVKTSNKYFEKNGLLRTLNAAVGLVYTTSVNIKTDDGLINGATCVLKKIDFFLRNDNNIPSILWVSFDDETIGQQWRQRYSNLYREDVHKSWTPIFAVDRYFPVTNAQIIRTQFPLKPAAASTIHSGQGCTFDQICINMDLSDSKGLSQNRNLARLFLQHAHYVAASRVTSLQGLQILSWNKDLISVNNDVRQHMEYLLKQRKVELCYTPVYMMDGLKCSFLNTRSLHKHFRSVETDHNVCASDIMFLAETRLISSDDNDNYEIQNFQIVC